MAPGDHDVAAAVAALAARLRNILPASGDLGVLAAHEADFAPETLYDPPDERGDAA